MSASGVIDPGLKSAIGGLEEQGVTQEALTGLIQEVIGRVRQSKLTDPARDSAGEVEVRLADLLFQQQVTRGLTIKEAADHARLSTSRVQHLVSDGDWPSVKNASGKRIIPMFVFGRDGRALPGITAVAKRARAAGWSFYSLASYMTTPRDDLGGLTPQEWMDDGQDLSFVLADVAESW